MLNEVFRCPICRKNISDPEQLRQHRVQNHRGTIYGDDWLTPQKNAVDQKQPKDQK